MAVVTPQPVPVPEPTNNQVPLSQIDRAPDPVPAPPAPPPVPISQIDRRPNPIDAPVTSTAPPLSNIDLGPDPVTGDPAVPNSGPAQPVIPVTPAVEIVTPTGGGGGGSRPVPIYISVDQNGNVVVQKTLVLNFLGAGVTVTASGSQANITIPGGGGGGNLGNWAFVGDTQYNFNGGYINNSDLSHGATAVLGLPANGDGNAVSLLNYYGAVSLTAGTGPSQTKNWTFGSDGTLTVPGNLNPNTNNTYSLGNATNQWRDLWVSNATIYMNSVPIGLAAGNVLTVNGQDVITTNANGTIDLANLAVDNNNIYNTQGQGVVISNFSFIDEAETAYVQIPAGNTASDLSIVQKQGNVRLAANTVDWTFDTSGNLTLPVNGSIVLDGGDGVIGPVSDDMVISWDNEEIRLVSVQGSIEMQADSAFRVQAGYDSGTDTYLSRWEFNQNEIVNITNNFGVVSEAGNLYLQGGRDTLSSGNVNVVAIDNGVAVNTWTFGNNGVLFLPNGGQVDNSDNNIELRSANNINFETTNVVNVYTADGNYQWQFGDNGALTLAPITTGEGTGESATISGTRTILGGFDNALPYAVEIPGHTEFGTLAWQATNGLTRSAKITFAVQSGGAYFQWEQFDVSVCQIDGANCFVTVSNRIKQNSAVADTEVTAYNSEGGPQIWLNPADGQTVAWVNYKATEFQLMVD